VRIIFLDAVARWDDKLVVLHFLALGNLSQIPLSAFCFVFFLVIPNKVVGLTENFVLQRFLDALPFA
jgi:hypothetical protein